MLKMIILIVIEIAYLMFITLLVDYSKDFEFEFIDILTFTYGLYLYLEFYHIVHNFSKRLIEAMYDKDQVYIKGIAYCILFIIEYSVVVLIIFPLTKL